MRALTRVAMLVLAAMVVAPLAATAQGSVAGVVKDTSGAVLPGATVEVSSPALIEKTRSAVTDGSGQYKIVDLRPGTYTVTFSLQGFNTVRREGIELTGSFTADVNAELKVGAVSETVTVRGESPVVDVQNTAEQQVLKSDVIDAIPTGRSQFDVAVLTPGASTSQIDVGGTNTLQITTMTIHGGRSADFRMTIDGVSIGNISSPGDFSDFVPNTGSAQEVALDYGAGSGEAESGGVRINLIPKEGGNIFKASFFGTGVNSSFQGNNYTSELKGQGLTTPNSLKSAYDVNPSGGGPIIQDRLWFYSAVRFQSNKNYVAGMYYNENAGNPNAWSYVPDLSQQGVFSLTQQSVNTRLTWQANPKNKFSFYADNQGRDWYNVTPTFAPEAASHYQFPVERLMTANWSSPLTSRLLVTASLGQMAESYRDPLPAGGTDLIGVQEQGGLIPGLWYRGRGINTGPNVNYYYISMPNIINTAASVSYVTGAHALKVGFTDRSGSRDFAQYDNNQSILFRFNNGVPNQIWERATPLDQGENLHANLGAYVQDKWTVRRLTLNGGLRFDYLNYGFPAQYEGPGPFEPTRNFTFPEVPSFISFKDLSPRFGAAYDLFGNGKTALKASASRYVIAQGSAGNSYASGNPVSELSTVVTRSWKDSSAPGSPNYYVPQCNLQNPLANGDCGTISDLKFGTLEPSTSYDPAVLKGWGIDPYDWEFVASVQQQLLARASINVGYFRRIYGNFLVTQNTAVTPSDYSPFSIAAPTDPRLPGGGGYTVGGLYDLNPAFVGKVSNYVTNANNFGGQLEHWNGVDVNLNLRLQGGFLLQGGLSTGRTMTDDCNIVNTYLNTVTVTSSIGTVQSTQMCHLQTPFLTQIKLLGTYTIPKIDVLVSGTFQSFPGPVISANYNAPNAVVQPSLGRPLSGGAANTLVNLVAPGTLIGQQANQLDWRFAKIVKLGRTRTSINLDLYNLFNANPVLTVNSTYTASGWQAPQSILNPRLFKISAQFDF